MVHDTRLKSTPSPMLLISYTIILLSICKLCMSEEDISRNLVRDPIELGNPYHMSNTRGTNYGHVVKRKHPNHRRRPQPTNTYSYSAQTASTSDEEEEESSVVDRNMVRREKHDHHNSRVGDVRSSHHIVDTDESEEEACPLCAAARKNSKALASLDEETLRAVRVEIVKQQILKKLRLKEPPKMDNVPKGVNTVLPPIALGNPVLTNTVRNEQEDDVANLDLEDFYGKTEQIIVLPQDEISECASWASRTGSEVASCFVFNLPREVRSTQISSAQLWVYKFGDILEDESIVTSQHNLTISEVVHHYIRGNRKPAIQFNPIVTRENITESAGWINFNITDRARKWLINEVHEHTIKISCSTCTKDSAEFPFDSVGEQQPFIVFNIANGKRKRRNRRSLNCTPGIKECCRESLYISFEEIEWDWVLEPKGFDAYYCKGKCHGDAALAHTATRHSGIMIDYVKNQGGVNNKTVELVPCCTATEMSSISLVYRDPQSYNTTFQHVKLPNMVVQSCGCK